MPAKRTELSPAMWLVLIILLIGPRVAVAVDLSGTIRYTGALAPVSAERPIEVLLYGDAFLQGDAIDTAAIIGASGNFDLTAPIAGQYYVAYFVDLVPDSRPSVGEPFRIYNRQTTLPGDPIVVPQSGVMFEFNDATLLAGLSGTVMYTGAKGPVAADRGIVVQAFADPDLIYFVADDRVKTDGTRYDIVRFENSPCFLVAFLDLNNDRQRQVGEPFQIYRDKGGIPGDAVVPSATQTAVDFTFGDENIPVEPTPSPTLIVCPTESCVGDCDQDLGVGVNEVIVCVNVALGNAARSSCVACDPDCSGAVTIDEVLRAVNAALNECPL